MTLKQALSRARDILIADTIEDASLESELLLRHTLNISRVQLYQDLDCELSSKQEETFWNLIKRRLTHEPTAYIIRHREFYGLDFHVNPSQYQASRLRAARRPGPVPTPRGDSYRSQG